MKKSNIIFVVTILAGLLTSSCTKWSTQIDGIGTITTHTLQINEFSKIKVEGSDNVVISYGPEQKVSVTGHPNINSRVQTQVNNDTWNIVLERGSYGFYELSYHITMPLLEGVINTGSGDVTVSDQISVDRMKVSLIGSGSFFAFPLITSKCEVDISGSGECEITVNDNLDVVIDGSGSVYYKGSPLIHEDITGSGRVIEVGN